MVNTSFLMHENPYVRARPELPWPPPQHGDDQIHTRLIDGKIWDLLSIRQLAQQVLHGDASSLKAITKDCRSDMQRLQMDDKYAARLLLLLNESDHYINSRWCHTGASVPTRPALGWVPCDAYKINVEDDYDNGETLTITYYIKFCLSPSGSMVLLISLHESNKDTRYDC